MSIWEWEETSQLSTYVIVGTLKVLPVLKLKRCSNCLELKGFQCWNTEGL